jgi:S1-C subfamily serine protease
MFRSSAVVVAALVLAAGSLGFLSPANCFAQDALERLEGTLDEPLPAPELPTPAEPPVDSRPRPESPRTHQPGYLGVVLDELSGGRGGVIVSQVREGGPAEAAGLKAGDIIARVNGRDVPDMDTFGENIGGLAAGDRAMLEVVRDGRRFEFTATLIDRAAAPFAGDSPSAAPQVPEERPAIVYKGNRPMLGLRVGPMRTPGPRIYGSLSEAGAVVEDIVPGSPAERHGVPRGALIVALNGVRIVDADQLMTMMGRVPGDRPVELTYILGGRAYHQSIPLGGVAERPRVAPAPLDDEEGFLPPPPEADPELAPPRVDEPGSVEPEPARPPVKADADRILALERELGELLRRAELLEAELKKLRE